MRSDGRDDIIMAVGAPQTGRARVYGRRNASKDTATMGKITDPRPVARAKRRNKQTLKSRRYFAVVKHEKAAEAAPATAPK